MRPHSKDSLVSLRHYVNANQSAFILRTRGGGIEHKFEAKENALQACGGPFDELVIVFVDSSELARLLVRSDSGAFDLMRFGIGGASVVFVKKVRFGLKHHSFL